MQNNQAIPFNKENFKQIFSKQFFLVILIFFWYPPDWPPLATMRADGPAIACISLRDRARASHTPVPSAPAFAAARPPRGVTTQTGAAPARGRTASAPAERNPRTLPA